jgi:hypothetical protein
MGVTKKAKITFTCEPELKDGLEVWAQSESRTLSNLVEMLIRQAYGIRENLLPSKPAAPTPAPPENKPASVTKAKRGKGNKPAS